MKNINKYKKSDISPKIELSKPYEIINELLISLNTNLSQAIISIDEGKMENAKQKAKRRSRIQ